jgi:hypothetical protein
LFIRTGLPPRIAKRILTHKEAVELRLWVQTNPIDDQSNHHLPVASLQSTVANIMGGNAKITDYLIFNADRGNDIDAILRDNFEE